MSAFLAHARQRLASDAIRFQGAAAVAHDEAVGCAIGDRFRQRVMLVFASGFQRDAAFFARRARECLFELIGAEPEEN